MDIFNKRIMVLNEADRADKYDIDKAEDDATDAQDDENTDTNAQPTQDNEQTDDTTNNQQQEEQTDSDQGDANQESDPEQPSEDDYLNEELPNRMSIPQIDIMDGMSEIEHSLNNLKLLEQFNELYVEVKDCLYGNTISNISVKNAKQRQAVDIVRENLSSMLADIHTYTHLRFSDIYEENMIAYITYLKRFKIAMKILKIIVDENSENEQNK